jgi:hypothetical protein
MISGSYTLAKGEGVGVLNLLKKWEMKLVRLGPYLSVQRDTTLIVVQLRNLVITNLSNLSLTPVERSPSLERVELTRSPNGLKKVQAKSLCRMRYCHLMSSRPT